jgi:nicotinate-nucleotide adenylyltransferase
MVHPPIDEVTQLDPSIILIEAQTTDVSSTAIRQRLATGQTIDGLVPPLVAQHLEHHGLYSSMTRDQRRSDMQ